MLERFKRQVHAHPRSTFQVSVASDQDAGSAPDPAVVVSSSSITPSTTSSSSSSSSPSSLSSPENTVHKSQTPPRVSPEPVSSITTVGRFQVTSSTDIKVGRFSVTPDEGKTFFISSTEGPDITKEPKMNASSMSITNHYLSSDNDSEPEDEGLKGEMNKLRERYLDLFLWPQLFMFDSVKIIMCHVILYTFMHLAEDFIQSKLQKRNKNNSSSSSTKAISYQFVMPFYFFLQTYCWDPGITE